MFSTGWHPKLTLEQGIRALVPELKKCFGT